MLNELISAPVAGDARKTVARSRNITRTSLATDEMLHCAKENVNLIALKIARCIFGTNRQIWYAIAVKQVCFASKCVQNFVFFNEKCINFQSSLCCAVLCLYVCMWGLIFARNVHPTQPALNVYMHSAGYKFLIQFLCSFFAIAITQSF